MIPWRLYAGLGAAVVFILGLGVAAYKLDKNGYDRATAEFTVQRLQEATEANIAYVGITLRYRQKEARWAKQSAAISKNYQKRIASRETQHLADIAAIDARTLRLFDPGTADPQACRDSAPATPATAGRGDGSAGSGLQATTARVLSVEASRFLLSEASRADAVVEQLTACQAIITEDRK